MRWSIGLLVVAVLLMPALASAQAVIQVNTIEVDASKVQDYLDGLKKLEPILGKHAPSAKLRVWQSTVAGPNSNRVSVVLEFSNAVAWAEGIQKVQSDPAFAGFLRGLEATGRKIVSVSLATEVTP